MIDFFLAVVWQTWAILKEASVFLLIATPETGIDSISLSYAPMDPVITVARPVAGVVTAVTAGLAANFLGDRSSGHSAGEEGTTPEPTLPSGRDHVHLDHAGHGHAHGHDHDHLSAAEDNIAEQLHEAGRARALRHTAERVYRYAFRELRTRPATGRSPGSCSPAW